ncbi:hypothetical protein [Patulibacter sp.]|uniref:hypothetical protein n=1 Tax=Patulibacter sp. TaxID=1912859 RepID=UPI002725574F|nr:hypothetical protein [Patulibacter sp.]MDO9409417.1 hypothetical protein [Patulibacter sp.]
MIRSFKTKTVAIAAVGLLTLGGGAYAATSSQAPTPLTGGVTDKAADAVVAKYPDSTLVGIESRPDGTFEARVRKADGAQVGVTLDKDFKVTATREGGFGPGGRGGGPGGFGGHGHGGPGRGVDVAALAKTLGVTETKLQAAIEKVRPAEGDRRDERVGAIAKALGASQADVASVLQEQRGDRGRRGPGGPGGGPRGDDSALVTALAKKTGTSEADVRTALKAARPDRDDRFDELSAALAKELGLDAAKVKAALEAARPTPPAGRP